MGTLNPVTDKSDASGETPQISARSKKNKKNSDLKLHLEHKLLHIPFGTGVILPGDQLHAGHYGKEHDARFHAILSNTAWVGKNLWSLPNYIPAKYNILSAPVVDKFFEYATTVPVSIDMKEAKSTSESKIGTMYGNTLKECTTSHYSDVACNNME